MKVYFISLHGEKEDQENGVIERGDEGMGEVSRGLPSERDEVSAPAPL